MVGPIPPSKQRQQPKQPRPATNESPEPVDIGVALHLLDDDHTCQPTNGGRERLVKNIKGKAAVEEDARMSGNAGEVESDLFLR